MPVVQDLRAPGIAEGPPQPAHGAGHRSGEGASISPAIARCRAGGGGAGIAIAGAVTARRAWASVSTATGIAGVRSCCARMRSRNTRVAASSTVSAVAPMNDPDAGRVLHAAETIEHIVEHPRRLPRQRVAEAAAARPVDGLRREPKPIKADALGDGFRCAQPILQVYLVRFINRCFSRGARCGDCRARWHSPRSRAATAWWRHAGSGRPVREP
jgi:hypothetical protein